MREPLDQEPGEAKPDEGIDGDAAAPRIVSDARREAEERFRALTEHARDAILEIGGDARMLYVSPGFTEAYGYQPEEVLGRSALELVHPDEAGQVEAIRTQATSEEREAQLTFRLRHRDGSWRWVELAGRPYRTSRGELRGVLVARDVTDRTRAEQAFQKQLEIETRLANLSRRFLNLDPEDFEGGLQHGLESAAEVAGAERAELYVVAPEPEQGLRRFQWNAEGIEPYEPDDLRASVRRYHWFTGKILGGEAVHVPSVAGLPPEAAAEREGLARHGVCSYLAIPIVHDGRALGFLGFYRLREERGWAPQEILRLVLIAEVLGNALRRLNAELERRATDERFRSLIHRARDTICETTMGGRVLFMSDNVTDLCGYTMEEIVAIDPWSLVHPEDLDELRRQSVRAATHSDRTAPIAFRSRHRDGTWRWLEATLSPFTAASGSRRLAVVVRDVSARQQRRLELERLLEIEKRVAEFSRALLEAGADEVDAGIRHGLEAAARLAGADRAYLISTPEGDEKDVAAYDWEAPGVPPRPCKLGIEREKQAWVLERLLAGEHVAVERAQELPDEARQVRESLHSGGIRSLLCIPINSEDELRGVLGFHCLRAEKAWSDREITMLRLVADLFTGALRRKRTETRLKDSQQRLLQAQKMEAVGTLAGGVAHDFNNQLTVMLANARFLAEQVGGDEELRQGVEDLHRAAEHCAQLTRSLLAFSRQTAASPRALDVGAVVAGAGELLRPLIPSSIRFEVEAPGEASFAVADPTQLQQVLVNLVVNARDAMPDGGILSLRAVPHLVGVQEAAALGLADPGPYVEFNVCDTGTGMDPAVRARIFEPFFTTKPVGRGTGLGLATAYGIVQQCRGAIGLESEPGRGSSFRVLIPQAVGPEEGEEGPPDPERRTGSGTVLLAEDETSVRRLAARMLREGGYTVLEAPDGADALRIGRQKASSVDALVTDIDMPRLNGLDLARRLTRSRPDLPVLFISGTVPDPLVPGEPDPPARHSTFLVKPFAAQDLLAALHELLVRD
jgi:PAS domain S-box-containing protein